MHMLYGGLCAAYVYYKWPARKWQMLLQECSYSVSVTRYVLS